MTDRIQVMYYYEVLVADGRYHGDGPLTYSYDKNLPSLSVVSVTLRNRATTGIIIKRVQRPDFDVKEIKYLLSQRPLPAHCLKLAQWMKEYYSVNLSDALRQFTPSRTVVRRDKDFIEIPAEQFRLDVDRPLTKEQQNALRAIEDNSGTTVLLHGVTGSGKTRVYLELADKVLRSGRSVIILTPEIALTAQLAWVSRQKLKAPIWLMHSGLSDAERKKIWFKALEASEPVVLIGPRSALFLPLANPGLIIVDEFHEPAFKQEQSPRYHAVRVASQLGHLTSSRVVLGSATPPLADYYLASEHGAVIEMKKLALTGTSGYTDYEVVDIKDRKNFTRNIFLSNQLIKAIEKTLENKKQVMIFYNRRGTARLILCSKCGWQMLCPNCDVPLVYHGDEHSARCHICGYSAKTPSSCPVCNSPDILFRGPGTKTIFEEVRKLFPTAKARRFDSDNRPGERLNELYEELLKGDIDILVGTQLIAKGLDLPHLGLVGVVSAESSLTLPDFTADERVFQLLYQVAGRVGRGHTEGKVLIQSYHPENPIILAALTNDWDRFYRLVLDERRTYRFPPFSYLMKLSCRRATAKGAENAARILKEKIVSLGLPVEIIGPTPSFYYRRGGHYYYQLVVRAKDRKRLQTLASMVPSGWTIDLDPQGLI